MAECNDHDILIELKTMMGMVLDRFKDLPGKCIMHDETIKTQCETIKENALRNDESIKAINDRLDKSEERSTWAWRFALGTTVTVIIAIAGWVVNYLAK